MSKLLGTDLRGKTIGIVGMGAIGIAVAKRAAVFGLKVLYYNRRQRHDVTPDVARYVRFEQLLRESVFVSVHAPLTEETNGMFDATTLALMKPTAVLINMARGQLVDTDALYAAIKSGCLGGAALDVAAPEPIAYDHPLLALPSVVVVPHIGSATYETREAMALLALENLQLGLSGHRLKACYNPDVYTNGALR